MNFFKKFFCKHNKLYVFKEKVIEQVETQFSCVCDNCGKTFNGKLFINSIGKHHTSQLCKKNTYHTKKDAETVLNICKTRLGKARSRKFLPVRVYRCDKCQGYHLTHKTKNKENYEK